MNGTALALPQAAAPQAALAQTLTELPFGSQSQVQTANGRLSAFLGFAGYDRSVGVAKYALRVLNNTSLPAHARLYIEVRGVQQDAYPLSFEIAPFSMRDDMVPVRFDTTGPYDRAIVEVFSEETRFTVDAPPPPPQKRNWYKWIAAGLIPVFAAGGIVAATPRVLAVAAPAKAVAGSTIRVPFQVSGNGSVEYDFSTRDGVQIAAGLAQRSDVLHLPIPANGAGAPYTLHVRMRNAFLASERAATIAAVGAPRALKPAPKPAAPDVSTLISDLSASPSPVHAGALIAVRYATSALSGDVWLLGLDGRTWARAPLSPSGMTQISVPQAAAGHDMRVVLHAQRGKVHAESSVGLTVLPSNEIAKNEVSARPAASVKVATPTLALDSQVVSPGDSVVVRVSGARGDVKITLMNAAGTTIEQGSVSESDGAISISAPAVTSVTNFYVVATYTQGISEQSIVKRLVVTPR